MHVWRLVRSCILIWTTLIYLAFFFANGLNIYNSDKQNKLTGKLTDVTEMTFINSSVSIIKPQINYKRSFRIEAV